MSTFFSEHRLLAFRKGPEVPPESPEPTPEQHHDRMPDTPVDGLTSRYREIAAVTMRNAQSVPDPQQREALLRQAATMQFETGNRLQKITQDTVEDVLEELEEA